MKTDLSSCRLNSYAEIETVRQRTGNEKFRRYRELVYSLLYSLPEGGLFDICEKVRQENRAVFIKLACLYIAETKGNCSIEFSNDYSRIRGIASFNRYQSETAGAKRKAKFLAGGKRKHPP